MKKAKRCVAAFIQHALWYEVQFYSDRIAFAGGVLAGAMIPLFVGLFGAGYGYYQSTASVIFGAVAFVSITFVSKCAFELGKKHGDREPLKHILEEWMEK